MSIELSPELEAYIQRLSARGVDVNGLLMDVLLTHQEPEVLNEEEVAYLREAAEKEEEPIGQQGTLSSREAKEYLEAHRTIRLGPGVAATVDRIVQSGIFGNSPDEVMTHALECLLYDGGLPPISDEELVASIKQGLQDVADGRTYSLEEVNQYFEEKSARARAARSRQTSQ